MHVYVVPEHEGSLNGKWFSGRRRIKEIDSRIHQRSAKEFGLKFMDGSKGKSNEEVEDLKRRSALREEIDRLQEERDALLQEQADIFLERFRDKVKEKADFSDVLNEENQQNEVVFEI